MLTSTTTITAVAASNVGTTGAGDAPSGENNAAASSSDGNKAASDIRGKVQGEEGKNEAGESAGDGQSTPQPKKEGDAVQEAVR